MERHYVKWLCRNDLEIPTYVFIFCSVLTTQSIDCIVPNSLWRLSKNSKRIFWNLDVLRSIFFSFFFKKYQRMILWSSFEENSSPKNGKRINSVLGYSWNLAIFKAVKSSRHLSWRPPYTSQLFYMVAYFERQVRVNQRVVDRYKPSGNTITVEITFSVLLQLILQFRTFFSLPEWITLLGISWVILSNLRRFLEPWRFYPSDLNQDRLKMLGISPREDLSVTIWIPNLKLRLNIFLESLMDCVDFQNFLILNTFTISLTSKSLWKIVRLC